MVDRLNRRTRVPRPANGAPNFNLQRSANSSMATFAAWIFWLVTARLIIPGFFDYGVSIAEATKTEGVFNTVTWGFFGAASAWLVFSRMDAGLRIVRFAGHSFLILLLFATLSVAWSMDPGATLRRLFHLYIILLACLAITMHGWRVRRFQEVVRPVITAFLVGSLIFGLVCPDLAIEPPTYPHTEYYWGGLTIGKNALGAIASTGAILWFHGWASREVRPLNAALGFTLSVTLIGLARAATYMLATSLVCALILLMLRSPRGNRRYMPYVVGALVLITIVFGLAVLNVIPGLDVILTPLTALSGRDRTFTNRALIWQIAREHIALNPIAGTGYGAFWANVTPGTPAYEFFVPRMFFNPGECHDGYLEIINDLGYLGLALLFAYLGTYLRASLRLLRTNFSQATLYIGVLFQQILSGLSESNWLWLDAEMLIFTLATFCLARHMFDPRPRIASTASASTMLRTPQSRAIPADRR
jgi:O-antigen ligase